LTPIEGLTVRGTIAVTDTGYSDDFINASGQNLKGKDGALSAKTAGSAGVSYDFALNDAWRMDLSTDARYNGGYVYTATLDPFRQDSFWLQDAAIRVYTANERYEITLIGKNLSDEIYAQGAGSRPGAWCPMHGNHRQQPGSGCHHLPGRGVPAAVPCPLLIAQSGASDV